MSSTHQFALYVPFFDPKGQEYIIDDPAMLHRLTRVLRIQVGDSLIIFNQNYHAECQLRAIQKKHILVSLRTVHPNKIYRPAISFFLPLLKRDAFEHALYFLVESGVQTIQPVITAKSQRKWAGIQEKERLERIIVAAAEQSKNYAFPGFCEPLSLSHALEKNNSQISIFFDPMGDPLSSLITPKKKIDTITLAIGPEGDLTPDEKALLTANSFVFAQLTPTILRAQEAAGVGACLIRTLQS